MGRVWLAFKVFFDVLFSAARAEQIRAIEASPPSAPQPDAPATPTQSAPPAPPAPKPSGRSDALTLLETLQREARLIDFLQEDIESYSDQQVGSAVREVHRGCRSVLQRIFSITTVVEGTEGNSFTVQGNEGESRIHLIGNVVEKRPVTGTLVHAGWRAEQCELPKWTGSPESRLILAPAEVELSGK
ncbi:DUF2760 domain-containing protein [Planctomicrobium sp. SH661]|uniref:DUF2760 domain-containing protein n=1 Tax=Planctomicrobium sp. SH661 TaxID=3448124 RepID=UPI003F5AF6B1